MKKVRGKPAPDRGVISAEINPRDSSPQHTPHRAPTPFLPLAPLLSSPPLRYSSMFASLLSSLTNPRISPSAWDPSSTLPPGSTSVVETFTAPISPAGAVNLTADTGAWSHGTVVFRTKSAEVEGGTGRGLNLGIGGSKLSTLGFGGSSQGESASGSTTPTQQGTRPGAQFDPDAPPSYEAIVASVPDTNPPPAPPQDVKARQLEQGGGLLEVRVEARWNDERLWEEAKIDLVQHAGGAVEIIIQVSTLSQTPLICHLIRV